MTSFNDILEKHGWSAKTLLPKSQPKWLLDLYNYGKKTWRTEGWIQAAYGTGVGDELHTAIAYAPGEDNTTDGEEKIHTFSRVQCGMIIEQRSFYCTGYRGHADFKRPYHGRVPLRRAVNGCR